MESIKTGKFTLKGSSSRKKKVNLINVVIRNRSSQPQPHDQKSQRGRNIMNSLSAGSKQSDNSITANGCRSYNEYQSSMQRKMA